jgi:AGCS family alanine or glycine:cation symporter
MADKNVLTFAVFAQIPAIGKPLITIALALFAFSTILGWSYYGERAAEYLVGPGVIKIYKVLFVIFTLVGTVASLDVVWNIADILNGLMVIPNVIAMICLSGVIVAETKKYINNLELESDEPVPVVNTKQDK